MTPDGLPDTVCWNCVKGRHAICTGKIESLEDSGSWEDHGQPCECPVCHANRHANRQPVWDGANLCYYDPGPNQEPLEGS
jgi:hypothetical protein